MSQDTTLTDFNTGGESDSDEGREEIDRPAMGAETRIDDSGAYTTPEYTTDGDPLPTIHTPPANCLSFTVSAPVAHFRKVETSTTRLTYGLPPRTTINGMLAAMLGLEVNSYYELFNLTNSALSINVETPLREMSMPIKHRNTDTERMTAESGGGLTLEYEKHPAEMDGDEEKLTQRVAHTVLRDVSYRINVWLNSEPHYNELRDRLEDGESYYTPSLGLSECLASISYHGEFSPTPVEADTTVEVDSAAPASAGDLNITPDTALTREQTPAEMEQVDKSFVTRRTTAYTTYQYRENGEAIPVTTDHAATVDGQTVIFK